MTSKDVFMFFTKFGPVEFAKVHNSHYNSYRFAFVTFESRDSRQRALTAEEVKLTLRDRSVLRVRAARARENSPSFIKSFTWVRSPGVEHPAQPEVQQSLLPPADPQFHLPGQQAGMSPMVPQYLLFNFTEEQQFFNHVAYSPTNQEIYSPLAYYNPSEQQNQMFNPAVYYYPTTVGLLPPHYQQLQFPQYEVENPGSHVQNETNL